MINKDERKIYEKIFKKVVIEHIRDARIEKGWTQAQLAEAICVSHEYIRNLESEKGDNYFSTFTVWLISKALDVNLDQLLDFDMEAFHSVIEKAMQGKINP